MGVIVRQSRQEDKMQFLVLATVATLAYGRPQAVLPAGLTAAACPNYPFCGAQSPADFPVPVVNGEPVAPVLNTTPDQTRYYQEAQLVKSPANFPSVLCVVCCVLCVVCCVLCVVCCVLCVV